MAAVRIDGRPTDGWLGFDLAEVLATVGDWPHLEWVLRDAELNCDVTKVWPEGVAVSDQTMRPGGLAVSWDEMRLLASSCSQIVDGTFVGYRRDGSAELSLAVIDSSYWIVWAQDDVVLDRVRAAFVSVSDYDEPPPPPCR